MQAEPASLPSQTDKPASDALVRGRVVDSQGQPVEGVAVIVRPFSLLTPPLPIGFVTDAEGRFSVSGLTPGRYTFVAIHGQHPPGAMEAVPVFAQEQSSPGHVNSIWIDPLCCPPEEASYKEEGQTAAATPPAVVDIEIVLDRHNVLEA